MPRKDRPSEHPRYFRVTAVRSHTVPIVKKLSNTRKPFVNGPRANARVQTLSYSRNRRGAGIHGRHGRQATVPGVVIVLGAVAMAKICVGQASGGIRPARRRQAAASVAGGATAVVEAAWL